MAFCKYSVWLDLMIEASDRSRIIHWWLRLPVSIPVDAFHCHIRFITSYYQLLQLTHTDGHHLLKLLGNVMDAEYANSSVEPDVNSKFYWNSYFQVSSHKCCYCHYYIQSSFQRSNTHGTDENSRVIRVELCSKISEGTTKRVWDIYGVWAIAVQAICSTVCERVCQDIEVITREKNANYQILFNNYYCKMMQNANLINNINFSNYLEQ